MKTFKFFIAFAFLLSHYYSVAQQSSFVAARNGLSIRENPDLKSKVLGKIPFGTKLEVEYPDSATFITTEGLQGVWVKVSYGGKTGFITDSYLLPLPPPKAGTEDMSAYLQQVTGTFGNKLVLKSDSKELSEEYEWTKTKQLYKNGSEWHHKEGYEYGNDLYILPGFTVQQGFLLVRMLPEFNNLWTEKDTFPTTSKKVKKGETEYEITVEKEKFGLQEWVKKIEVSFEEGAFYNLQMYRIGDELVIIFDSGV